MQAYGLLPDEENGKQDEKIEVFFSLFVSFHGISKATYLLVPKPEAAPTKLPLQRQAKKFGI